jgi:hypothetical protein
VKNLDNTHDAAAAVDQIDFGLSPMYDSAKNLEKKRTATHRSIKSESGVFDLISCVLRSAVCGRSRARAAKGWARGGHASETHPTASSMMAAATSLLLFAMAAVESSCCA